MITRSRRFMVSESGNNKNEVGQREVGSSEDVDGRRYDDQKERESE